MTTLDLDAPVRSLRTLAGLSIRALAAALGLAAHNAVAKAEKAGDGIELRTVRRYAAACGYDVVITLTRKKPTP